VNQIAQRLTRVAWLAQLAEQMKEWEDFAQEPVKVLGSVS
jgi:hypothetical protein